MTVATAPPSLRVRSCAGLLSRGRRALDERERTDVLHRIEAKRRTARNFAIGAIIPAALLVAALLAGQPSLAVCLAIPALLAAGTFGATAWDRWGHARGLAHDLDAGEVEEFVGLEADIDHERLRDAVWASPARAPQLVLALLPLSRRPLSIGGALVELPRPLPVREVQAGARPAPIAVDLGAAHDAPAPGPETRPLGPVEREQLAALASEHSRIPRWWIAAGVLLSLVLLASLAALADPAASDRWWYGRRGVVVLLAMIGWRTWERLRTSTALGRDLAIGHVVVSGGRGRLPSSGTPWPATDPHAAPDDDSHGRDDDEP